MIHESWVWREELRRLQRNWKRQLKRTTTFDDTDPKSEQALAQLEKFVFGAAFAIRKLSDCLKLSDEFEGTRRAVTIFPCTDQAKPLDWMYSHWIGEFYDLESPRKGQRLPRSICNQLIHSFVFMADLSEDLSAVDAFLFNSDKTKRRELVRMTLNEFVRLVEEAVEDEIISFAFNRGAGIVIKSRSPHTPGQMALLAKGKSKKS